MVVPQGSGFESRPPFMEPIRVTIDFETRSARKLKECGPWVYSEDPNTDALCLAYKFEGDEARIVIPPSWDGIEEVLKADEIWAHHAMFEYCIWQHVCVPRYGWPPLPVDRLRCSAAVAAMHGLPRKLGDAGKALGLSILKDKTGHGVMRKLAKPWKVLKRDISRGISPDALLWHEDPAMYYRLYDYCLQDVEAEEALLLALRPLPEPELRTWQLDQEINRRGFYVDLEGVDAMIEMVNVHQEKFRRRLRELTGGKVKTAKQTAALREYLESIGLPMSSVNRESVDAALARDDIPDEARKVLEVRQSLARSSSAKYEAIKRRVASDGRVHDSLLYHGAATGRWSGAGVQPQNFPSRIKVSDSPEKMLAAIKAGGYELFTALYDDDPMAAAGAITRSVIMAAPGNDFVVADYSAIEGRGLAWLAGEEWVLNEYRRLDREGGPDMYMVAAGSILGKDPAAVTPSERQSPGKISELACGYAGGAGAVRKFGGGVGMTDDEIRAAIVTPWRKARPNIVAFWDGLEKACYTAVENPGAVQSFREVSFKSCPDGFLKCRLPSGRILYYYDPKIQPVKTSWGAIKASVTYMTVNTVNTVRWMRVSTYGGKLAENVTQAICRDIMVEAMSLLEAAGYPIHLTVHDEIVSEVLKGFGSLADYERMMGRVPTWAEGFPIRAEGWRGERYKK